MIAQSRLDLAESKLKICTKCIYDARVSSIQFDHNGVCNYCHQVDALISKFGTGQPKGESLFNKILEDIKRKGKNKPYDCIIGVSGGTDSSYLVYLA